MRSTGPTRRTKASFDRPRTGVFATAACRGPKRWNPVPAAGAPLRRPADRRRSRIEGMPKICFCFCPSGVCRYSEGWDYGLVLLDRHGSFHGGVRCMVRRFFPLDEGEPDALRRNEIGGCRYRPYCGFDKNNRKGRENKNIRACFRPRSRHIAVRVGKSGGTQSRYQAAAFGMPVTEDDRNAGTSKNII